MEKIFYTDVSAFQTSDSAVEYILRRYFGASKANIARSENGKPYFKTPNGLFFSISHTKNKLFIAFSDKNVGIDAEEESRSIPSSSLLSKFTEEERNEIQTTKNFLLHWTAKESAIKWLGGTLAHDLKKLTYCKNILRYNGLEIPIYISHKEIEGHILSVCCERDFSTAEVILL